MLKATSSASVAFLFFILAGCGRSVPVSTCPSPQVLDDLRSLKYENASKVADSRYESGHFKFLAVYGYSIEVVGVPEGSATLKRYGYKIINGTTDAPCNKEHAELVAGVRRYAEIYNRELLERLGADKESVAN